MVLRLFFFFFFSSRRRHTRSLRDWSSDVCSSDLAPRPGRAAGGRPPAATAAWAAPVSRAARTGSPPPRPGWRPRCSWWVLRNRRRRRVAQQRGNARRQFARAERLGEQPGAQALRLPQDAVFTFGGEDDDGKRPSGAGGAELAQQIEPGPVWQMEIEQHGVEGLHTACEGAARFTQGAGEAHHVAEALQMRAQQQSDMRLVVNDEEVPPDGRQTGDSGSEKAGDRRTMAAQVVEQP